MKLYCGKNLNGIWKASLNEAKVDKFSDLFESDVDVIHNNKVYMIRIYHGYDYNYGSDVEQLFMVAKKTRSQQIIFFKCRLLKHKTSDT